MSRVVNRFGTRSVIEATLWSLGGFVGIVVIRLGSNLLMTRLLAPEMFGLMALAMVIIHGLAMMSDIGLQQIAVKSNHFEDPNFKQTLWSLQIARGVLIFLGMLGLAFGLYIFAGQDVHPKNVYLDPSFPPVLATLAFIPLLSSLEPIAMLGTLRHMEISFRAKLEGVVQLVGSACMIGIAHLWPTVWALVLGSLIGATFRLIVTRCIFSQEPIRLKIWPEWFTEIFRFGKWLTIASTLGFTAINVDRLLLGILVPAQILALYAIAFLLISTIEQAIGRLVNTIALPVFSDTFRKQPEKLCFAYYKILIPIASAMWFAALFLNQTSPVIIKVLYDARYEGMIEIFSVLSLLLLSTPGRLGFQALMATGDVKATALAAGVRTVTSILGILVLHQSFGIVGIAIATVLSAMTTVLIVYKRMRSKGLLRLRLELLPILAGLPGYFMGMWTSKLFA